MKLLTILVVASLFVASCETIKGVGRDIESVGDAIDDGVDDD